MSPSAASGERNAVRGYRWQYDQLAAIVYDSLLDETYDFLRLSDPDVGIVDDLVLVTTSGHAGHQFKNQEPPGAFTFTQLVRQRRTRSGEPSPSFVRALSAGWLALRDEEGVATVSLITNQWPSVNDRIVPADAAESPAHNNFAGFLTEVLNPIAADTLQLADLPSAWAGPIDRMREESQLDEADFEAFLKALRVTLASPDPLITRDFTRADDIQKLSEFLFRKVSNTTDVVVFNRSELLAEVGWSDRARLRSSHQFPVDLDTYEPLDAAAEALSELISDNSSGYIALVGPPGSGKSTLLAQSLMQTNSRVIRYYAYVPGTGGNPTRLENRGYLHDVVLLLEKETNSRGHLLERSVEDLREAFVSLLDTVSKGFMKDGRKTLIVVDGLDHVERDNPDSNSLLRELLRPEQVPEGILFIVGTRSLSPLHPSVRQSIEDTSRIINLRDHRLPHEAVMAICRRVIGAAQMGDIVHGEVARLANGHPLSLGYLLNLIANADGPEDALQLMTGFPAYAGDIAQQYRAVWESLEADRQSQELLAIVARLRIPFEADDLLDWFDPGTCRIFRDKLGYLFRFAGKSRRFFHDSFRQFIVVQSNPSDQSASEDPLWDAAYQRMLANLCARAARPHLKWEEFYHRYRSGQEILELADQLTFREQVTAMRDPEAVREDLGIILKSAAKKRDSTAFIDAVLAKSEAEARWSALESIDVPAAFLDADLPAEAIAYSGIDRERYVPLSQAYRLASRLGRRGNADGRRIFDAVEPGLFDDAAFTTWVGREDDVYEEWALAATMYRPLAKILAVVENLHPGPGADADDYRHRTGVGRFARVIDGVLESLSELGRAAEMQQVDDLLERMLTTHHTDSNVRDGRDYLVDSRLRIIEYRLINEEDAVAAADLVTEGLAFAKSVPLRREALLCWAEVALQHDHHVDAEVLLRRTELNAQIDTHDLGYSVEGAIDLHFWFWRLRHRLLRRRHPERSETVLDSVPPHDSTPAGNSINAEAAVHGDPQAVRGARETDLLVRLLAASAAATDEDMRYEQARIREISIRTINASNVRSSRRNTRRSHRIKILQLMTSVVLAHGLHSAEMLAQLLGDRIQADPNDWPVPLRLVLGKQLYDGGVTADWYSETIAVAVAGLGSGELDLNSRLENAVDLIRHLSGAGRIDEARQIANSLVTLSFGVGYRKDYQFTTWVEWLGLAIDGGLNDPVMETVAVGRLITAASPMTEGLPGEAGERLPALLATRHPGAAVALFEHLVRVGTVDHLRTLSQLIPTLAKQLGHRQTLHAAILRLVTDLSVRCTTAAQPQLLKTVIGELRLQFPDEADEVIRHVGKQIEREALPTTRSEWLSALRSPHEDPSDAAVYGSELELVDGTRLTAAEVITLAGDATTLAELKNNAAEDSSFKWSTVIDRQAFSRADLELAAAAFQGETSNQLADVLVSIGRQWLRLDCHDAALACATAALDVAHDYSWGAGWGTSRRDAHSLAIAAGGEAEKDRAWMDITQSVANESARADVVLDNLKSVVGILDSTLSAAAVWPLIRCHIEGMGASLDLDGVDPVECQPLRWWVSDDSANVSRISAESNAADALAVLIVDHATHFLWMLRDPAIATGAAALGPDFPELEATIETVLRSGPPDDIAEALGRMVDCSGPGNAGPDASDRLHRIHNLLANHPNQFVRDLTDSTGQESVRLPARYGIALPLSTGSGIGVAEMDLGPYEQIVRLCASSAGFDEDLLVLHAKNMMRTQMEQLPAEHAVQSAVSDAGLRFMMPYLSIFASRAVAGRVVRDFRAAGYLNELIHSRGHALRSFDKDLVGLRPTHRPPFVPAAPPAGHDTDLEVWIAGTSERLRAYTDSLGLGEAFVIATRIDATVLNWTHAQEEFTSSIAIGEGLENPSARPKLVYDKVKADLSRSTTPTLPRRGDPLAVKNDAFFHQLETDWMAFAPWLAAHLGWSPLPETPGAWVDSDGKLAVHTIEWVDGWPGHGGPAFDDTEEMGTAVIATPVGARAIAQLGVMTRTSRLHRRGRDYDSGTQPADNRVETWVESFCLPNDT